MKISVTSLKVHWVSILMVVLWIICGIIWYRRDYFFTFSVIQLIASWNVYAFFSRKWMMGYDLMRGVGPNDEGFLRGFLLTLYVVLYILFLYVYISEY